MTTTVKVRLPKSVRVLLDDLTPAEAAHVLSARLTVGSFRVPPTGDGCLATVVGRDRADEKSRVAAFAFDELHYDLQHRGLYKHHHMGPASPLVVEAIRNYVMGRRVRERRRQNRARRILQNAPVSRDTEVDAQSVGACRFGRGE